MFVEWYLYYTVTLNDGSYSATTKFGPATSRAQCLAFGKRKFSEFYNSEMSKNYFVREVCRTEHSNDKDFFIIECDKNMNCTPTA